jgi:hypothetical protein
MKILRREWANALLEALETYSSCICKRSELTIISNPKIVVSIALEI